MQAVRGAIWTQRLSYLPLVEADCARLSLQELWSCSYHICPHNKVYGQLAVVAVGGHFVDSDSRGGGVVVRAAQRVGPKVRKSLVPRSRPVPSLLSQVQNHRITCVYIRRDRAFQEDPCNLDGDTDWRGRCGSAGFQNAGQVLPCNVKQERELLSSITNAPQPAYTEVLPSKSIAVSPATNLRGLTLLERKQAVWGAAIRLIRSLGSN